MFDLIVRELANRFGLGDKAGAVVQLVLGYLTDKNSGGLSGFVNKMSQAGLGDVVQSWMGGNTAQAKAIAPEQIQNVFGGQGGLLGALTSKLGVSGSTATSALGFVLPALLGKLTPNGSIPTSLPTEVTQFLGSAKATGAAASAAVTSGRPAKSGFMKWLPWIIAAALIAWLLSYCNGKEKAGAMIDNAANATASATVGAANAVASAAVDAASTAVSAGASAAGAAVDAAQATGSAAVAATAAVAQAIPKGAGVLADMIDGMPVLKVYFDTGKTVVSKDFAGTAKDVLAYLKDNPSAKAVVSGYNDPTGNAAANAELSKKRAQNVAAALKAAGVAADRVVLEKPANTEAGAAVSNAEARRVEIVIRK